MSRVEFDRREASWHRGVEALAMREYGMTYIAIAAHYGVTPSRAAQIVEKAERLRNWKRGPISEQEIPSLRQREWVFVQK
jgi:hypothetical protein